MVMMAAVAVAKEEQFNLISVSLRKQPRRLRYFAMNYKRSYYDISSLIKRIFV